MTETNLLRNKAVVADMIEAVWRQGDLTALPVFWTEDCVNHADPHPDRRGLARLKAYHESFQEAFAEFRIEIVRQVAEGDTVATQIAAGATHIATGASVTLTTIRIDLLQGGKIAEHWSVAETAGGPRPEVAT